MKKEFDRKLLVRRAFLVLLDILLINLASFCAIAIRFDFKISKIELQYSEVIAQYAPIYTLTTLLIFFIFRLYHSLWKYASIEEMTNVIYACTIATVMEFVGLKLLHYHVPRSYTPLNLMFLTAFIAGSRFCYRTLRMFNQQYRTDSKKHIMIIGAGEAASGIIKEIDNSQYLDGKVVCAIDDDKNKINRFIQGVKVVGNRYTIVENVEKFNVTDIIIAIPNLPKNEYKKNYRYL